MCGIIGYIGEQKAASLLIEGLKRLEYRGYDSSGIATIRHEPLGNHLMCTKRLGKIVELEGALATRPLQGTVGIGHTRWATHGEPSKRNSHPHVSLNAYIAVVHNGIIENHDALRKELVAQGFRFLSDTDTEVLPHLIERELSCGDGDLESAVGRALMQVQGAYAIAVISPDHPDEIVAASNSSPLVIGVGEKELYLASDELALAGKVSAVVHVRDGEIVTLRRNGTYAFRGIPLSNIKERLEKPSVTEETNKGGLAHYMYKEILEQPQAMRNVLAGRLRTNAPVTFGGFTPDIEARLRDTRRIILAGCGTSLFAATAVQAMFESVGGVMCEAEQAAEFCYRNPILSSLDTVVGISQSGETADTLKAIGLARDRHALCLGVTNRVGSVLSRHVRAGIYLHAGPEIAVASTKAFTTQVVALAMLAIRIAELRGLPLSVELREDLLRLPFVLAKALKQEPEIKTWTQKYTQAQRVVIIGRGSGVSLAMEAALKIREVAYMDAHGLSAAELKHGTLALIEKGVPVLALMPSGKLRGKMLSCLEEVKARGGEVMLLEPPAGISEELVPVVLAPAVQLFAYHLGVARGVDVDQPRNLAKAVTVE
ncbi:hypothetical protein A3D70_00650 [Candidatus Adlerbacteria bacterium RIFCSPHIGHO2_02_FULL_54_18]|uniref:Glutamine--fructose-6-phosphate aminotransferase [isomerizing] n=2 Tax=Candidatus Adleribacteriota TaxID=1752736 RepID=A0A1F4Y1E2_9BACT|nr:MAG: hypothetical protein A2949_01115 [Candidatus Adlerbacteria bacterium RIFCSPLOWO2_01_FULL_54_21b]OGC87797.1 MAG: hypothetical protein A3D70_00650 [Candidatus Adlerbacteria bacterium RIFCSPHIGHO2_02_FULL_54_18]